MTIINSFLPHAFSNLVSIFSPWSTQVMMPQPRKPKPKIDIHCTTLPISVDLEKNSCLTILPIPMWSNRSKSSLFLINRSFPTHHLRERTRKTMNKCQVQARIGLHGNRTRNRIEISSRKLSPLFNAVQTSFPVHWDFNLKRRVDMQYDYLSIPSTNSSRWKHFSIRSTKHFYSSRTQSKLSGIPKETR